LLRVAARCCALLRVAAILRREVVGVCCCRLSRPREPDFSPRIRLGRSELRGVWMCVSAARCCKATEHLPAWPVTASRSINRGRGGEAAVSLAFLLVDNTGRSSAWPSCLFIFCSDTEAFASNLPVYRAITAAHPPALHQCPTPSQGPSTAQTLSPKVGVKDMCKCWLRASLWHMTGFARQRTVSSHIDGLHQTAETPVFLSQTYRLPSIPEANRRPSQF